MCPKMLLVQVCTFLLILSALVDGHPDHDHHETHLFPQHGHRIPIAHRTHWMKRAIAALTDLKSPCHFEAFGAVIVNHTDTSVDPKGRLICIGVNAIDDTGNPTLHGEIAAINNCTTVMKDENGEYRLSRMELREAWKQLSSFAEYIYATSSSTLVQKGWDQISVVSKVIFEQSKTLSTKTHMIGNVLANETDPLFSWQFDPVASCPKGCARAKSGLCEEIQRAAKDEL